MNMKVFLRSLNETFVKMLVLLFFMGIISAILVSLPRLIICPGTVKDIMIVILVGIGLGVLADVILIVIAVIDELWGQWTEEWMYEDE